MHLSFDLRFHKKFAAAPSSASALMACYPLSSLPPPHRLPPILPAILAAPPRRLPWSRSPSSSSSARSAHLLLFISPSFQRSRCFQLRTVTLPVCLCLIFFFFVPPSHLCLILSGLFAILKFKKKIKKVDQKKKSGCISVLKHLPFFFLT